MKIPGSIAFAIMSLASPVLAGDFSLASPVGCSVGEDQRCYIQFFMDRDQSPAANDFTCQGLTYDGHSGTDFALRSWQDMRAGVPVLAAAPGIVSGVRDGMGDAEFSQDRASSIEGRDCGNGVVVRHEDGWVTQYCHMRNGSPRVRQGDRVAAGDVIGLIGMSGRASFPHLHFSVRKDEVRVDPFAPSHISCGENGAADSLWKNPPQIQAGGLVSAGFSAGIPEYRDVKSGAAQNLTLSVGDPALVLWGMAFNARAGDILTFEIRNADGQQIHKKSVELDKSQPLLFRATGRKANRDTWFKPGIFTGFVTLSRNGHILSDTTSQVSITPRP